LSRLSRRVVLLAAQAPGSRASAPRQAIAPAGAAAPAPHVPAIQRTSADSAYIAVLGLVFAGGTVVAGWLLYRQSREFRDKSEQSIREHRAILGAIVES
jgi:hypothetical protein